MNLVFIPLFIFILFQNNPSIAANKQYVDGLLIKARNLHLSEDRYWKILLHYRKTLKGWVSYIDDPNFFLSPSGKKNPEEELRETIKGFFRDDISDDKHPICRFPARFAWLKKRLSIDESKLPVVKCNKLKDAIDKVKPQRVALIFAASYMNAPASMFGHTFLRIDGRYKNKLLSHAVNYAANTQGSGAFSYVFKGIFGGFKGFYHIFPYYKKIAQYNDIEHRDIWEYELDFNKDEVKRMFLHLWELKEVYQYYYFFDENCSYNILFLIESAKPDLHLTDQFTGWVIPVDTIRVIKGSGIVRKIIYRPSLATRIRNMSDTLSPKERLMALNIVNNGNIDVISNLNNEKKIKILDLASEYIQYKFSKRTITRDEYIKRFLKILKARKDLGSGNNTIFPRPSPELPENGHSSGRVYISAGLKKKDIFYELRFRPAYHDLYDDDRGYQEGSQIVFVDTALRYFPEEQSLKIQAIDIIDIFSVSPRDIFFKPKSWRIYAGINRKIIKNNEPIVMELKGGTGIAGRAFSGLLYALPEIDTIFHDNLEDRYSLGAGMQAGTIISPVAFWKVNMSFEILRYFLGDGNTSLTINISNNFRLKKDLAVRFNITRNRTYHRYTSELTGGIVFYY